MLLKAITFSKHDLLNLSVLYVPIIENVLEDIGRETPVFNMFLNVEISVENPFIP